MKAAGRLAGAAGLAEPLTYWPVTERLRRYKSIWKSARGLADDLSFDLTFGVWKQPVALALMTDHQAAYNWSPKVFAVIGDGHGFLGTLIRRRVRHSRVYCMDLPKILVLQAHTHEIEGRSSSMSVLSTKSEKLADITFVQPKGI